MKTFNLKWQLNWHPDLLQFLDTLPSINTCLHNTCATAVYRRFVFIPVLYSRRDIWTLTITCQANRSWRWYRALVFWKTTKSLLIRKMTSMSRTKTNHWNRDPFQTQLIPPKQAMTSMGYLRYQHPIKVLSATNIATDHIRIHWNDRRGDTEHALELDAINRNPCMKMILLIIHELHTSITPPPKEMAKEESTMPSWMKDIYRKFINPSTPPGINMSSIWSMAVQPNMLILTHVIS